MTCLDAGQGRKFTFSAGTSSLWTSTMAEIGSVSGAIGEGYG